MLAIQVMTLILMVKSSMDITEVMARAQDEGYLNPVDVEQKNTTAKAVSPAVKSRREKKMAKKTYTQEQVDAMVASTEAKVAAKFAKSAAQAASPVGMTEQAAKVVATLAKYSAKDAETKVFRDAVHPRIRFMKGNEKWNDSAKIVPETTADMPSNLLLFRGVWKKGMSIRDVQERIAEGAKNELYDYFLETYNTPALIPGKRGATKKVAVAAQDAVPIEI
jgi:hypothetical protein